MLSGTTWTKRSSFLFLLLTIVLQCFGESNPNYWGDESSYNAFYISPNSIGSQDVQMKTESGNRVTCHFKYDTNAKVEEQDDKKQKVKSGEKLVDDILKKYATCFTRTNGVWEYETCLAVGIKQTLTANGGGSPEHPTIFSLGKFEGIGRDANNKILLRYGGGDDCSPNAAARSTSIVLACGPAAELSAINEPRTCAYAMTLRLPEVCQHPDFVQEVAQDEKMGPEEPWYIELMEYHDGAVRCHAQHSGFGNPETHIPFKSFELQMSGTLVGDEMEYSARHIDRLPLSDAEMETKDGRITSTSRFLKTLQYVSVTNANKAKSEL
eukprot:TRINITY_DN337_c0_g1_i1.p1 TRINITY_DN337_c0_g1~~TRINITY_DN337_c0_g1_i1.p1  ORF type:complete len:324 (+),score=49.97 TRINITY_DN337_c0_g1_i1:292-1263(+)